MKTFLHILLATAFVVSFASSADDPIDQQKLFRLHQRVRNGEKLTPEEQTYYERGKAEREKRITQHEPATTHATASTGMIPLTDMTADARYHGEDGGLYGGGSNTPPEAHLKAALEIAGKIQPLDAAGKPSPDGKIVLLTHGMSNTTQESQAFIRLANASPEKNPSLVLVDGAQGGVDSRAWLGAPGAKRSGDPWKILEERVRAAGATPQQVQVVWMKHAMIRPTQFGDFPKHAVQLKDDLAEISRRLRQQFPNLRLAYLSSRIYAGYATTELNPEPYAYESAFAVRWLIQDQIKGEASLSSSTGKAPLFLWGPYLWAAGEKGRKSGDLIFKREDLRADGTHPSETGQQKVAAQLLKFFTTDPTAKGWFLKR